MGMYGNYIAIDNSILEDILDNDKIFDIDIEGNPTLDIDKSWQAIYYTLCDDIADGKPPLSYIVPLDGQIVATQDEDFSFFVLTADEVKEAVEAMNSISKQDFKEMYNFEGLIEDEIYPSLSEEDDPDQFLNYLTDNFEAIQVFYNEVSSKNMAILFYVA